MQSSIDVFKLRFHQKLTNRNNLLTYAGSTKPFSLELSWNTFLASSHISGVNAALAQVSVYTGVP